MTKKEKIIYTAIIALLYAVTALAIVLICFKCTLIKGIVLISLVSIVAILNTISFGVEANTWRKQRKASKTNTSRKKLTAKE